jgi:hypothetical protein
VPSIRASTVFAGAVDTLSLVVWRHALTAKATPKSGLYLLVLLVGLTVFCVRT